MTCRHLSPLRIGLLAALLLALAAASVACAPAPPTEEMASDMEEGPQTGGTLVVGTTDDIINFDAFSLGFVSYPMQNQCYDSLILYDKRLNIMPRLATAWETNAEGHIRHLDAARRRGLAQRPGLCGG